MNLSAKHRLLADSFWFFFVLSWLLGPVLFFLYYAANSTGCHRLGGWQDTLRAANGFIPALLAQSVLGAIPVASLLALWKLAPRGITRPQVASLVIASALAIALNIAVVYGSILACELRGKAGYLPAGRIIDGLWGLDIGINIALYAGAVFLGRTLLKRPAA